MNRRTQLKTVYQALFKRPMTMKECEVLTGIDRANICRYCRTFRQSESLYLVKKRYCSITKHRAGELTTNPDFAPPKRQFELSLF